MGNIFISHSSADNAYAQKVMDFLKQVGHQSVFLDFDPNYGIPAGRDWEKELYNNLRKCQVVIILYSRSFSSSQWCFAEITHAKALGKYIIPLKINDCEVNSILLGVQIIDAAIDEEEAFKRLANGLLAAGINKEEWDNSRPPYPGLLAFEEEDAPIFFGREEETENLLKSLRQFRSFGGPNLLLVLGASGTGKSSLIRAGVIPLLRKDKRSWIIISPFRPLKKPFEELSKSLANAFNQFKDNRSWKDVHDSLNVDSGNALQTGKSLSEKLSEIISLSKETGVTVLIFIDQFEELLLDNYKTGNEPTDESTVQLFISALRILLDSPDNKVLIIATLRSDFLGKFQQNQSLKGLTFDDYIVKSVSPESLRASIAGPATVAGIQLQDGLVEVMLKDTGTSDALPLLAFTLRELWEQYGQDGLLEIDEYRDKLGGLEGSVARVAEAVLIAYIAQTGRGEIRKDEAKENKAILNLEDDKLLKAAFMAMVRIDEEGRYTRRFTKWEELPAQITDLLQRFVSARLLVISGNGKDVKIEVAHEALFRTWKRLVSWLEEDRNFIVWRKRLNIALEEWERSERNESELLRGPALAEAMEWLNQYESGKYNLTTEEIEIIKASDKKDKEETLKEEKRRLKELRNLRILVAGAAVVVLIICGFGYWIYRNNIKTRNNLAKNYWDRSRAAKAENNLLAALFYTAEGLSNSKDELLNEKMLLDIEPFLPATILKTIIPFNYNVNIAVFSPDGNQVLIAGDDSTARILDSKSGKPVGGIMKHNGAVYIASFSSDGKQVLTASNDSTARTWNAKTGAAIGAPMKHDGLINIAEFSPDGNKILTASKDRTARLWNAKTGAPIGASMEHDGSVFSAMFSPDGKEVLTASSDELRVNDELDNTAAHLWDARTGAPIGTPLKHDRDIGIASFSPDGKLVLTAGWDNTARLWDAKTGVPIGVPMKHDGIINSAVVSEGGTRILTSSLDGTARLWDTKGNPIGVPMNHGVNLYSADFSGDEKQVFTTSSDNIVRLWDAETAALIGSPIKHDDFVNSAIVSPDGKLLLTASDDNTARLCDLKTGAPVGISMKHDGAIKSAEFSFNGKQALTVSSDNTVRIWDVKIATSFGTAMKHDANIGSAVFSPDGNLVLTASNDGLAGIWDAKTGAPVGAPLKHDESIRSADFSADGKLVVTAGYDKTARLWDAKSRVSFGVPMKHKSIVTNVVFSLDGNQVLTKGWDNRARIWDAKTGLPFAALMKNFGNVHEAAFSSDGKQVVTTGDDSTVRIWDAKTGISVGAAIRLEVAALNALFSPDGKQVVIIAADNSVRLYDAKSGAAIGVPMKHVEKVNHAVFSPDGKSILTASEDNTARIWDVKTGTNIGVPIKHDGKINSAGFSPDGKLVLTASRDQTARMWDAKTGLSVGAPMKHDDEVNGAVFSPDGKQVLTASKDKTARVWNVSGDLDISADLFKLQANAVSGVEFNIGTGETHCIPAEQFEKLKAEYSNKGKEHYQNCEYPKHNLWSRFYPEEAKKIRTPE